MTPRATWRFRGTLRAEAESNGEPGRFEVLQRWLVPPAGHDTAIEATRSLNLSDGAFKVVVDRIATTVDDPVEVQDELNDFINAMTLPVPSAPWLPGNKWTVERSFLPCRRH